MGYSFLRPHCWPALESPQDEGQPAVQLSLGSVALGDPIQLRHWTEAEYNAGTSVYREKNAALHHQ